MVLTIQQIEQYECAFKLFDKNGNGKISAHELSAVLKCLNHDASDHEISDMINEVNGLETGEISLESFLRLMESKLENIDYEDELREAFRVFDNNNSGYISSARLKHVMECLGEDITAKDAEDMIKEADVDKDGLVNFEDFVKMMKNN